MATRQLLRTYLVVPPQLGLLEGFSSGLISLASYTQVELPSANVSLLDLSTSSWTQAFHDIVSACQVTADRLFVGITTTTATYQAALRVAGLFKRVQPDCLVVLGGHHASPEATTILRWHSEIDFVVRGEGEIALVELLRRFPDLADVPNLVYRDGDQIIFNPLAPLLSQEELDRIPLEYSGVGLQSAPGKFGHVTYVSARGCPLPCAFCSVANEKIRAKSVEAVIRDLSHLVKIHGYKSIAIEDNFFAHSPRRTLELCGALRELRQLQPFSWDCQTRVESLQASDITPALASAGCEAVYIGVEAFHPELLMYLRKTTNPAAYLRALEEVVVPRILDLGMKCYLNLQVGFPDEKRAHRDVTLSHLERLGKIAKMHGGELTIFPQLHVVYPGTAHWSELSTSLGSDAFERFTAWEAESRPVLTWLGKRFAHGTGGIPVGLLEPLGEPSKRTSFSIDPVAIMSLEAFLDDIAGLAGVSVFKYGEFLATENLGSDHACRS